MIFCVEDDSNIRELVIYTLETTGFKARGFEDGKEFLEALALVTPELILLDIMLPGMDGVTAIRKIRQTDGLQELPIMLLTAKEKELDKVVGLDCGADDYMVKPFGVLELSARIRSLLRRAKREEKKDTLTFEDIVVNKKTREVTSEGHLCELTLKEFELLVYLMENQSRVVTRDELLNQVWGYEYDGETRTLDMHIRTLRQKLGDKESSCIKTVRGVGYRLVHQEG